MKKGMAGKFIAYSAAMLCVAIVSGGAAWKMASEVATKRARGFFAPMTADLISAKPGDTVTTQLKTKSGNGGAIVDREGFVVVSESNKIVRAVFKDKDTGLTRVVIGSIDMQEAFGDAVEEFASGRNFDLVVRPLKQHRCIIARLPTAE